MFIPSWIGWNLLRKDQFPNLMHAGQHHLVLHLFHLLQQNIFYQSMWKLFTFPSYSKCIASEGFPFDIFDIFDSWFVALLFSVICSLTLMLPSCCKLQNNLQLYYLLLCKIYHLAIKQTFKICHFICLYIFQPKLHTISKYVLLLYLCGNSYGNSIRGSGVNSIPV